MGNLSIDYYPILLKFLKTYKEDIKNEDEEYAIISDSESGHCLLVRIGWKYPINLYSTLIHFEVKEGKVWIHRNNTEELIGDKLTKLGIPSNDIILGFQPEHRRPHTGFATA